MEVVRVLRNIFLRSFVVGACIGLVFAILTIGAWDVSMSFAIRFLHTDVATLTPMVLRFFSDLRFFLWFFLLTPGLALHWTLKAEAKRPR